MGKCPHCPRISFAPPEGRASERVTLSLWTYQLVNCRKQYGLFKVSKSLAELSQELAHDVRLIIRHVFTAAMTWAKLDEDLAQLRPGVDVVFFEDYQRNFELFHAEMATSMAYGANSFSLAMFPVGIKFRREAGGDVLSAAVVFLSTDLRHCFQQVDVFERR